MALALLIEAPGLLGRFTLEALCVQTFMLHDQEDLESWDSTLTE